MRIVTFNAQHGRAPDGKVDTAALARYCAALGADVVGLQELDAFTTRCRGRNQPAAAARAAGMAHAFGPARRVGPFGRYGNALLVRGSLADVAVLALPSALGGEPRAAVLATALVAGSRLSAAVTHLSVDPEESRVQLGAVVAALGERPPPRLLLGDLNRGPADVVTMIEAAGLTLADPTLPTFPAARPRSRIDHVAVAGLEVRTLDVLPAAPVSDHRALQVEAVG
jgi:endonuclease/exonuclease/phosphatase family metal-dependent hydrolase